MELVEAVATEALTEVLEVARAVEMGLALEAMDPMGTSKVPLGEDRGKEHGDVIPCVQPG
jgi:hypothetical protein